MIDDYQNRMMCLRRGWEGAAAGAVVRANAAVLPEYGCRGLRCGVRRRKEVFSHRSCSSVVTY